MAKQIINFTKAAIESLPLPQEGQRIEFYDSKVNHLLVRVSSTGRKTFQVYRWYAGKPSRITIGTYPDLSIEQVRKEAEKLNADFAKGENPADKKRALQKEMTFANLFTEYLERHAKTKKRSWKADQEAFTRHLANTIGSKKLSTISRKDIAAMHSNIGKEHPTAANRILALVSSVFGRAIEFGLWESLNPCLGVKRFPEQSRDRFLSGDELSRFFQALEKEPNATTTDFFLIALLTGARRANVLSMQWKDLDLKSATWKIQETKNGTPQTVHLTGESLEVLQARRKCTSSFFVFPGKGVTGHLVEPKKAWARICKSAGIEGARIHDLRRTLGSWQAITGSSLSIIGKSLNHKSHATTAIYARLDMDPVRASVEKATAAMMEAVNSGRSK